MFIIRNKQMEVFRAHALRRFDDEMVAHVKEFFPNHYHAIGENNILQTIHYGYSRAENYGFTTQRNVCLYLNTMLTLGSNFDNDPMYPWAGQILRNKGISNDIQRIDQLLDKAEEVFEQLSGPHDVYSNRALMNLKRNTDYIFKELTNGLNTSPGYLNHLFPEKYEVIGEQRVEEIFNIAKRTAINYGFTLPSNILIYTTFMFFIGSGFDIDPQFTWAGTVLKNPALKDENLKAKMLYDEAITILRKFILYNNN